MAKLQVDHRTGKLTKVLWIEIDREGQRTSCSKQLHTEEQARTFLQLVVANGDKWPSYVELDDHGLIDFALGVNPRFVLSLRAIVLEEILTAEDKIMYLERRLKDI